MLCAWVLRGSALLVGLLKLDVLSRGLNRHGEREFHV